MSLGQGIILFGFLIPIVICLLGIFLIDLYENNYKKFTTATRRRSRELREKQEEIEFKKSLYERV